MLDTFAQCHYLLGMDMYSVQNLILFNNTSCTLPHPMMYDVSWDDMIVLHGQ